MAYLNAVLGIISLLLNTYCISVRIKQERDNAQNCIKICHRENAARKETGGHEKIGDLYLQR